MTDLAVFRDETRNWLEENCPPEMKKPMTPHGMTWGGRNCKFTHPDQELWLKRLGEKGWTAPTWPKEYGGGGLNFDENKVCLLYTSPSPRDRTRSRMPSSA